MTQGTKISYAHRADPKGQRFCQYDNSPVPVWAVDVRSETDEPETDPETERLQALRDYLKDGAGIDDATLDRVLAKMNELGL